MQFPEQLDQSNFMTAVDRPHCQPIDIMADTPLNGEFVLPGLKEDLQKASNQFFLEPGLHAALGLDTSLLQQNQFIIRRDWAKGREASAQGVFFGEMGLVLDDGEQYSLAVACKPYFLARGAAIHEYSSFNYMKKFPWLKTFTPVGFWVDDRQNTFLLTHFEEEVMTLDNVDWQKRGEDPPETHLGLFDALEKAAQILARLHAQGIIHGDAQIKNMAVDHSQVRLVDLTLMRIVHDYLHPKPSILLEKFSGDIKKLVDSIYSLGFLRGNSNEDKQQVLRTVLVNPYLSILRHPSSPLHSEEIPPEFIKELETMLLAGIARDDQSQ